MKSVCFFLLFLLLVASSGQAKKISNCDDFKEELTDTNPFKIFDFSCQSELLDCVVFNEPLESVTIVGGVFANIGMVQASKYLVVRNSVFSGSTDFYCPECEYVEFSRNIIFNENAVGDLKVGATEEILIKNNAFFNVRVHASAVSSETFGLQLSSTFVN
jgi:predicted nucleic-acid-binding Zn-ribbon protein